MLFLLNHREIQRQVRIPIHVNLLSIGFLFKPPRNLRIRKDFKVYQSTFSFFSFKTTKKAKDK